MQNANAKGHFAPLPVMFFNKKITNHRLTSENQKLKLFKTNKVDFVINIKFNKNSSYVNISRLKI